MSASGRTNWKVGAQVGYLNVIESEYLEVVALAERLHRQFLDVIQQELDRHSIRDINSVQALILHNIGESRMTVSELMWRGCYLGSNVSYNLKKLTEAGYIDQERSVHDKRVIIVRRSHKGVQLCDLLRKMNERHLRALADADLNSESIASCRQTLRGLQSVWSRTTEVGMYRSPARVDIVEASSADFSAQGVD
jgi:DNA-binding MarR family transcriptional regulator